jgi:hypothetical protein
MSVDAQIKNALIRDIADNFARRTDVSARAHLDSLNQLRASDNIPLLQVVARVTKESKLSIGTVQWHYNRMQRLGVERPEETLTTDLLSIYITVQTYLGILSANGYDRTKILDSILTSTDRDAALIEDAVVKREMTSNEDVAALVADMKRGTRALSEGAL